MVQYEYAYDVGCWFLRSKNGLNSTMPFSGSFLAGWILYLQWNCIRNYSSKFKITKFHLKWALWAFIVFTFDRVPFRLKVEALPFTIIPILNSTVSPKIRTIWISRKKLIRMQTENQSNFEFLSFHADSYKMNRNTHLTCNCNF